MDKLEKVNNDIHTLIIKLKELTTIQNKNQSDVKYITELTHFYNDLYFINDNDKISVDVLEGMLKDWNIKDGLEMIINMITTSVEKQMLHLINLKTDIIKEK